MKRKLKEKELDEILEGAACATSDKVDTFAGGIQEAVGVGSNEKQDYDYGRESAWSRV